MFQPRKPITSSTRFNSIDAREFDAQLATIGSGQANFRAHQPREFSLEVIAAQTGHTRLSTLVDHYRSIYPEEKRQAVYSIAKSQRWHQPAGAIKWVVNRERGEDAA